MLGLVVESESQAFQAPTRPAASACCRQIVSPSRAPFATPKVAAVVLLVTNTRFLPVACATAASTQSSAMASSAGVSPRSAETVSGFAGFSFASTLATHSLTSTGQRRGEIGGFGRTVRRGGPRRGSSQIGEHSRASETCVSGAIPPRHPNDPTA